MSDRPVVAPLPASTSAAAHASSSSSSPPLTANHHELTSISLIQPLLL